MFGFEWVLTLKYAIRAFSLYAMLQGSALHVKKAVIHSACLMISGEIPSLHPEMYFC